MWVLSLNHCSVFQMDPQIWSEKYDVMGGLSFHLHHLNDVRHHVNVWRA
jgi:hypothetical protein